MTDQGRYRPRHGVPTDYVSKKQLDKKLDAIDRVLSHRKVKLDLLEERIDNIVTQIRALVGSDLPPPPPIAEGDESARQRTRDEILAAKRKSRDSLSQGQAPS